MRITAVPPFRGEFGLKIRYHVPAVAALPRPTVVCIEEGEEALYPDATHILVQSPNDDDRRDLYITDAQYVLHWRHQLEARYPGCTIAQPDRSHTWEHKRFIPSPFVPQRYYRPDVVLCPRYRRHGVEKNWGRWPWLETEMMDIFNTFVAGARETSYPGMRGPCAWETPRALDATIEAMLRARLVIATDAGLAHLAVLCGAPLLLIGYGGGLVAPGAVSHADGRVVRPSYWPIRMEEYYHKANHRGALIEMVPDGWEHPHKVVERALDILQR